jgi:hypothetical protein
MARYRLDFLAALLLAASLGAGGAAHAQATASHVVTRTGEAPVLEGEISDMAMISGGRPRISAKVADDIFASGGQLQVDGASADHLIIAGGKIELAPATVHDLVAAGGRIALRDGVVSDDAVIAGGAIHLDRSSRIGGSAILTGGRLLIEAPVGGELRAAGGRVELNGPVAGDVRIRAERIVLGPEARVGGDLYVRGARIELSPGAVVQGRTVRQVVRHNADMRAGLSVLGAVFALGLLLMNGVIAAAAPGVVGPVDQRLRSAPWPSLGVGVLIALLTPLAIGLLAATVIGAPLAIVLGLAYLLAIPIAFAGVAYWLGQWIRGRVSTRRGEPPGWPARFGWTLAGALLILLACIIPFVGWLVWIAAFAAGVGALAVELFGRRGAQGQATK